MAKSWEMLSGRFNPQIERAVSERIGRSWKIESILQSTEKAMHGAATFAGGGLSIFIKEGANPFSHDQFIQEAWGLGHIRANSHVATPEVIGVLHIDGITLLIMELVKTKPPQTKADWEILGRGLAELHRTQRDRCGLETHSYLGIFKQVNTQMDDWLEFFAQRRLMDSFRLAEEAGKLSGEELALVGRSLEKIINKLPDIAGPQQPFSLLHGDPWLANLLFDGEKLVLIDCSIYYGNREMDISTVGFFCPVSEHLFAAYHESYPIEPGYKERENLWRVNQWLGHVTLSAKYLPKLMDAMNYYL
ncbi:MAG: fructosamine kinase family protein [Christensenellales bacterium]|jgi:protein-ribulosamine 3-kinase